MITFSKRDLGADSEPGPSSPASCPVRRTQNRQRKPLRPRAVDVRDRRGAFCGRVRAVWREGWCWGVGGIGGVDCVDAGVVGLLCMSWCRRGKGGAEWEL